MNDKVLFVAILGLAITGVSFAIADPFDLPLVYAQVIETTGQNYDLIEDYNIGEAKWTSHPERIMINGEWENYFLQANDQQIIFRSNSVGGFIYDIPSCSYSIYENGFNGNQIIPSVSSVASYSVNGNWQNMAVNQEECLVNFSQDSNGIFITSTKTLFDETNQPIFQSYNGTGSTINVNGTSYNVISNGNQTGYYVDNFVNVEIEKFVQELKVDIFGGIKETFKVWNESNEPLGISQTVHTGESITIGENTLNIAELNGQSFSKQFLEDNKAQVFEIAESVNYDFKDGFDSLSNVNIFYDGNYKVNLDYASGDFVNYLEIDPTFTATGTKTTINTGLTATGSSCPSAGSTSSNYLAVKLASSTSSGSECKRADAVFDVSSIQASTTIISDVSLDYTVSSLHSNGGIPSVDWTKITVDPTTQTNQNRWNEISANTVYVSSDSNSASVGSYTKDLGTQADSDLQTSLQNGDTWFAIGVKPTSEVRTTAPTKETVFSVVTLQVTYAIPTYPQPPTNLQTVTGIPIELDWTAPVDDGGSALTGYKVYRTLNQYVMTELPNNGGTTPVDFTDNELLLHGESFYGVGRDSTYDATATNSPTTGVTGIIGNAWSLDGSNDNINVNQPILPTGTSDFTLSLWFNTNSLSVNQEILRLQNAVGSRQYEIFYSNGGSALIYNDGTNDVTIETKTNLLTNTWYNLVILRSSGTDYIYLNNVLKASDSAGSITTSHNNWYIGSRLEANQEIFNGELDEFAVWNKALSTNEISTLFNSGSGTTPDSVSSTDLRVYYDFEQTGSTLESQTFLSQATTDNSPNTLTVTANSGTTTTGQLNNAISTPNLEVTSSLLPDGTDSFTVGSWVKQAIPTPDSSDTFDSSTGWTQVGSNVSITGGVLKQNSADASTDNRMYKPIGTTLSNTFLVQYDFQVNSFSTNNVFSFPIALTAGSSNLATSTNMDSVKMFIDSQNYNLYLRSQDATTSGTNTVPQALSPNTRYYIDVIKDGTNLSYNLYSDSARQNLITTKSTTAQSGSTGYTHIQSGTMSGGNIGTSTMDIDNVVIYDGVTSVPTTPTNTKLFGFTNSNGGDVTFNVGTTTADFNVSGTALTGITWGNLNDVTVNNNQIIKTGSTNNSWSTGTAKSTTTYSPSTGGVTIICEKTTPNTFCGFTTTTGTLNAFSQLNYSFYHNNIYESGTAVYSIGTQQSDTVWKIEMLPNGTVKYYIDGSLVYTSSTTASGSYYIAGMIYTIGDQVTVWTEDQINDTIISATGLADNTSDFQHYALSRDGSSWTLYQNGASVATATDSTNLGSTSSSSRDSTLDGTNNGATTGSTGKVGSYAWDFTGASDYVTIGDTSTWKFLHDETTSNTISFWVKRSGTQVASEPSILDTQGGTASNVGLSLFFDTSNNLFYYISDGTGSDSKSSSAITTSTTDFDHLAFVQDWTNLKIYKNGSLIQTIDMTSFSGSTGNSAYALNIGKNARAGANANFYLDQLAVFSRALSATEISDLYNSNSGTTTVPTTNLVAHYNFEQTGNTLENQVYLTTTNPHTINIDGSIDEYFIDSTALTSNEIETVYGMGSEPTQIATTGTTPEYDDSGVTGGNTYYYYVKSTNAVGDSGFSTQATGLAGTPPDAPTGLSASIQNTNTAPRDIFLQWSAPTNVGSGTLTGFEIWRDGSLVTTVGLISSYVDIVPTVGTYTYTVKAVSTHGTSVDSNSAQITTPNLPDAPQGLTLSIDNPDPSPLTVTVTVSPPLNDGGSAVTGYNIYTSTDDITYTLQASNTSNPSNITVSSAGVWYFKAEAVNGVGAGALSSNAIIGTPNVPDAPTSVTTNIPDVNNAPSSVVVAWSNGLTNGGSAITGYNVYRDGSLLTSLGTGIFTYTDTATKTASTSYTYEVRITNNVGESLGTQSSITTPSPPNAPVLSVETGTTKATWTVPTSDATITNYKLYRDGSLVATVSGSTTTYIDRTLITFGNSYDYQVSAVSSIGEGTLSNTVTTTPDTEVDDATAFGTTGTSSIIDWTEPPYFQGEVTSYSVYYSTPYSSNPSTLIGTTGNTYLNLYNQLQYDTNYAFMVLVNSPLGNTSVGNVVNATTTENLGIVTFDPTTGSDWFDIDAVNQEELNLTTYTRTEGNGGTLLGVTYPTNYESMTCDINYRFGQETLQYTEGEDITATPIDAAKQLMVFQFNNQDSEVIYIECADQSVPNSASSYTLTTTFGNFPLLTQIDNFRSGEYGTEGLFGSLDLITLFVVIISMVGFNRVSPIAGVIIGVSALLGMAYFEITSLPATLIGVFALIAFLAWGVTRK